MQEKDETRVKLLYQLIGDIINNTRKEKGIGYLDFCHENDISTSTYDNLVSGKTKAYFWNIAKTINALGLNFEQFGKILDKKLPPEFWEDEE